MLVLGRLTGERIMIGDGPDRIVITLVLAERGKARIGIQAPRTVPVYREELLPTKPDEDEFSAGIPKE